MIRSIAIDTEWLRSKVGKYGWLTLVGLCVVIAFSISAWLKTSVRLTQEEFAKETELAIVFGALEGGPLRLASYQSSEIAESFLESLMTSLGEPQTGRFSEIVIQGGKDGKTEYATWNGHEVTPSTCAATATQTFHPKSAVYGFNVFIKYNACFQSKRFSDFASSIGFKFTLLALFSAVLLGALGAFAFLFLKIERLKADAEQMRIQGQLDTSSAIARTTQALAHDVRKPFSMFQSIIQIVEGTEDPEEVRELLKITLPEVNQAMASVEGLIQDVMQIGADAKMHMEDAAPEALIEAALGDLFRVYPEAEVSISYELSHRHMVRADSIRVARVFANILGNAVQAMREKGSVWIRTNEREGFVEFAIGNGGSVIPPESLPKLFDAFFTSGKKGGTGLGLAIAKKIVEAHGGTIRCVSRTSEKHPSGMVEFLFTLPTSQVLCTPRTDDLPRSSREIQLALAAVRIAAARQGSQGPDPREAEVEASILARLGAGGTPDEDKITILVVEDEVVYRNGLLSLLDKSEALSARIRMVFARNDVEAFATVHEYAPVLLIEDVDLGPSSKDGLEIVKTLRAQGFAGHICVHSNRFLAQDNRDALGAGADTVLPKPLGRVHFLKLILAALPEREDASTLTSSVPRLLSVAMLDDSISTRLGWKMELEDETSFRAFASTKAFFEACQAEPSYLSTIDVVITDYNFAPDDPHDGGTFARELRTRGYGGLILRSSGESDLGPEIEALFDGDVGKMPLEWPAFEAALAAARERA